VAGRCVALGIGLTAVALLTASALDWQLGLPTFVAGVLVTAIVLVIGRTSPWPVMGAVSWGVLPLVAGLFILVAAVEQTGVLHAMTQTLHAAAAASPHQAGFGAGVIVALASNLINNLPAGLIAANVGQAAAVPPDVMAGILIGVRPGSQSFGYRFAGHHAVADRVAPRGRGR